MERSFLLNAGRVAILSIAAAVVLFLMTIPSSWLFYALFPVSYPIKPIEEGIKAWGYLVLPFMFLSAVALPEAAAVLRQRRSLADYLVCGAVVGALPGVALAILSAGHMLFWAMTCAAPTGALTSGFYWLIRRPDRDQPAPPSNATSA